MKPFSFIGKSISHCSTIFWSKIHWLICINLWFVFQLRKCDAYLMYNMIIVCKFVWKHIILVFTPGLKYALLFPSNKSRFISLQEIAIILYFIKLVVSIIRGKIIKMGTFCLHQSTYFFGLLWMSASFLTLP